MLTDREIRRAARRLLDRHGAAAAEIAAGRAEALAAAGDRDGHAAWLTIATEVRALRAEAVPFAIC